MTHIAENEIVDAQLAACIEQGLLTVSGILGEPRLPAPTIAPPRSGALPSPALKSEHTASGAGPEAAGDAAFIERRRKWREQKRRYRAWLTKKKAAGEKSHPVSAAALAEARQALANEAKWRTETLGVHLAGDELDRRSAKVRGRTNEIVNIWLAREILRLKTGREPSGAAVARFYEDRIGRPMSPRSGLRRVEIVEFFEHDGMPWDLKHRAMAGSCVSAIARTPRPKTAPAAA